MTHLERARAWLIHTLNIRSTTAHQDLASLLAQVENEAYERAAKECWDYSAKRDGDLSKNYAKGFNNSAHDDGVAALVSEHLCNVIRSLKVSP